MKRQQTVYKVLQRRSGGRLVSAWVSGLAGYDDHLPCTKLAITYKLRRVTRPRIGKILAFDNLQNALDFKQYGTVGKTGCVWEAKAPDPEPISILATSAMRFLTVSLATAFWSNPTKLSSLETSMAPKGSVACSRITLIREVAE
jgi:hypothetical protein